MSGAEISLRQLLDHPSARGTVVLAGEGALTRPVRSVRVLPRLGVTGPLSDELAVVVDCAEEDLRTWRLDATLRRLRDAGACGVLLPHLRLPHQGTGLLADRLGIAVLGTQADAVAWAVDAASFLRAPEVDAARRLHEAHRVFGAALHDPRAVAEALTKIVGAPVAVYGVGGQPVTEPLAGSVRLPDPASRDRIAASSAGAMCVAPVRAGSTRTADLWLVTGVEGAADPWISTVRDLLDVGAFTIERWWATQRLSIERDARIRAGILSDLLAGRLDKSEPLRMRAIEAGWQLDAWHVAMHLAAPGLHDLLSLTDSVVAAFAESGLDVVVVERGDGWSAWSSTSSEPTADSRQLVGQLRAVQAKLAGSAEVAIGIGRHYQGVAGLVRSLAEAWDAARLARGRPASGHIVHIDRLGLAELLLAWASTETFAPTATALLAPLLEARGDLLPTLTAYLDSSASITETSATLGVHRNTVATRIQRVERLLGVDLSKPDDRLALHLACRVVVAPDG